MEAADETHLLYQAEEILGEFVWEQAEDIEEVSMAYWSMRKLVREILELNALILKTDDVLNTAHQERHEVLSQANDVCRQLEVKRAKYLTQADTLILERDQTIVEAKRVKRQFEATMTKVKVLGLEGGNKKVIASERQKIASYKKEFETLKKNRDAVGGRIQVMNEKVKHVEDALGVDRKRLRDEASVAYQSIGKANRDVSKLTSEVGGLKLEMRKYCCEIGRYVSQNVGIDPPCTEICKDHAHLIVQMQSLRSSIALNQKLAGMVHM